MIKIGSSTHGLGDSILLTTILKYFPNQITVQIPPQREKFSILFKDLAHVEITDNINICSDLGNWGEHYATRKLRNFFGDQATILDNRPLVLYSDIDSEIWASEYLKDKKNPVIFVPTCSKTWSNIRNIPKNLAHDIFQSLKKDYTPIVCQSSENFLDIGEHKLIDLDLKKYICLLRKVGVYYGANTGDEHLMTAVGGKTFVFQPEDNEFFYSSEWNYNSPNSIYYRWQKY